MTERDFLKGKDIMRKLGISRTTLWRFVRQGLFPLPWKIRGRNYWLNDEVACWLASRGVSAISLDHRRDTLSG